MYYLRATADFTLTFDENLKLVLVDGSNGIKLDIVLGKLPNNTEILVKNTNLDYNYSAYQELKYAILQVKYYIKVFDLFKNKYTDTLNQLQFFNYVLAGNQYKRLYLLTNTSYATYELINNIHLSQLENTQVFYDLIDDNKAIYKVDEIHDEYKLEHTYEFSLTYSDITAETLNINSFNKFKDILKNLDLYQTWITNLIGDN